MITTNGRLRQGSGPKRDGYYFLDYNGNVIGKDPSKSFRAIASSAPYHGTFTICYLEDEIIVDVWTMVEGEWVKMGWDEYKMIIEEDRETSLGGGDS